MVPHPSQGRRDLTHRDLPGTGGCNGLPSKSYELTIKDVPPVVDEEYMPPIGNYSFRVYFNYIAERDRRGLLEVRRKVLVQEGQLLRQSQL